MKKIISSATFLLLPLAASAQTTVGLTGLLGKIAGFMNQLFPIAVGIAVLVFFYEIIMFIYTRGKDVNKTEEFKKGILMSLVAIFVMLAFFGIIRVIASTIGIEGTLGAGITADKIPTVDLTPKGTYTY